MRESKIEKRFCTLVEKTGGMHRKVQWIGRRGAPDRWCGWPSTYSDTARTYWVELKKPATPLAAKHQEREHQKLRSCGERVYVLATVEAVENFIALATGLLIEEVRAL
jgi:hypothetical protein